MRLRPENGRTRLIAQAGIIAAVYAALTVLTLQVLQYFAWGPIQLRLSEAVTVLAVFTPAAIPGLTIGTFLANLLNIGQSGPLGFLDVVFGSLGTLLGAIWTWRFRKHVLVALAGPVISNALIVPAYLPVMLSAMGISAIPFLGPHVAWPVVYLAGVLTVGAGEAFVVYVIGLPLTFALRAVGILGEGVEDSAE